MKDSGFALIELAAALAILGLLIALALPTYQDYIARSQITEAITLASGLTPRVSEFIAGDERCPSNGTGGMPSAEDVHGRYVESVVLGGEMNNVGGCTATALLRSTGPSQSIRGKWLELTLVLQGGSHRWTCRSNAEQRHLPKTCVAI